ncbi:MAG: hypothetical protein LBL63_06090 [Clostridiales Family XIII bacterium]|jgi:hypothetical protein|nr:hypothetical protein [Clostridiales Family XIII bacterium]
MVDSNFEEEARRQFREALFTDGIRLGGIGDADDPDADKVQTGDETLPVTEDAPAPFVDADGKIKLSDIEKYLDFMVEKKVAEALRRYNIPVQPPVAETPKAEIAETKPETEAEPDDSLFARIEGAPVLVGDFTAPVAPAEPVVAPTESIIAPATPDAVAEGLFATPFGSLESIVSPFTSREPIAEATTVAPEPVAETPIVISGPIAEAPIVVPEPIAEAPIVAPATEPDASVRTQTDTRPETADEAFSREINKTFGPRSAGGSISFDSNRPQVKDITDKFAPITEEINAEQRAEQTFEEKFDQIARRADGKGDEVELDTDTILEQKIREAFEPEEEQPATAIFPQKTDAERAPAYKRERKRRYGFFGKAEKQKVEPFEPSTPDGGVATAEQQTGNDKLVFLLVAILVVGAVVTGILGNRGMLDISTYVQWIRDTFGNLFGG